MSTPNKISPPDFELWTARILLDRPYSPPEMQGVVTGYVEGSGITVVGYLTESPPALTLLRWPDNRERYTSPTVTDCEIALVGLAHRLGSGEIQRGIVPEGKLHTMMGRKKNGYGEGEEVSIEVLERDIPGYSVIEGHMISARTTEDGVESYGEKVGIIMTDNEDIIHKLGDELEQHHYAIERGRNGDTPGRTDFYETRWASNEGVEAQ